MLAILVVLLTVYYALATKYSSVPSNPVHHVSPTSTIQPSPTPTAATLIPPTISGIRPASGPTVGGTSVIIRGTDLIQATSVSFGETKVTHFTIDSDTQITATSPAGTGTVYVTVTTPAGTSAISKVDRFTYIAPPPTDVISISPSMGDEAGGTSVVITGTSFIGATSVSFGQTAAKFTVNSDTQITATSPAGTGTVYVTVTTPAGTSATSDADKFSYVPPTQVSPTQVSPIR